MVSVAVERVDGKILRCEFIFCFCTAHSSCTEMTPHSIQQEYSTCMRKRRHGVFSCTALTAVTAHCQRYPLGACYATLQARHKSAATHVDMCVVLLLHFQCMGRLLVGFLVALIHPRPCCTSARVSRTSVCADGACVLPCAGSTSLA
jgi:hypothetical protein